MKKEIVIAILIGLSLGLFITYGIYQARTGISRRSSDPNLTVTPAPGEEFAGELVLNSPIDETITTTDDSGNFSVEVSLEDNGNVITVYVIDEDGRTLSAERVVVVSEETFEEATPTAQPEEQ